MDAFVCGVCVQAGPVMAHPTAFKIVVTGKGGHGSQPHFAIDPVLTAAHVIVAVRTPTHRCPRTAIRAPLSTHGPSRTAIDGAAQRTAPHAASDALAALCRAFNLLGNAGSCWQCWQLLGVASALCWGMAGGRRLPRGARIACARS
jgi:hypothetical protein